MKRWATNGLTVHGQRTMKPDELSTFLVRRVVSWVIFLPLILRRACMEWRGLGGILNLRKCMLCLRSMITIQLTIPYAALKGVL